MKTMHIRVAVRKTKNYQGFESEEVITIQEGDDLALVKAEAYDRCLLDVLEQIARDQTVPSLESIKKIVEARG